MLDAKNISLPDQPHHTDVLEPARASRARFLIAVSVALLAHVAVAAPFLLGEPETGANGRDRDAISIDVVLVPGTAIESQMTAALPAPAASAEMHAEIGRDIEMEAQPQVASKPSDPESAQKTEKTETAAVDPLPTPVDVVAANPSTPLAAVQDTIPTLAATPGGVASVGADVAPTAAPTATAAAPGTAERYARSVVEALSRSRPKGGAQGQRGTVKVVFAIADDGRLKFARVAASSGNSDLDAVALAAVQQVTFPAPPNGLNVAQLTYEIPYRFR